MLSSPSPSSLRSCELRAQEFRADESGEEDGNQEKRGIQDRRFSLGGLRPRCSCFAPRASNRLLPRGQRPSRRRVQLATRMAAVPVSLYIIFAPDAALGSSPGGPSKPGAPFVFPGPGVCEDGRMCYLAWRMDFCVF